MLQAWAPNSPNACYDLSTVINFNGLAPHTAFKPTNTGKRQQFNMFRPGGNVQRKTGGGSSNFNGNNVRHPSHVVNNHSHGSTNSTSQSTSPSTLVASSILSVSSTLTEPIPQTTPLVESNVVDIPPKHAEKSTRHQEPSTVANSCAVPSIFTPSPVNSVAATAVPAPLPHGGGHSASPHAAGSNSAFMGPRDVPEPLANGPIVHSAASTKSKRPPQHFVNEYLPVMNGTSPRGSQAGSEINGDSGMSPSPVPSQHHHTRSNGGGKHRRNGKKRDDAMSTGSGTSTISDNASSKSSGGARDAAGSKRQTERKASFDLLASAFPPLPGACDAMPDSSLPALEKKLEKLVVAPQSSGCLADVVKGKAAHRNGPTTPVTASQPSSE